MRTPEDIARYERVVDRQRSTYGFLVTDRIARPFVFRLSNTKVTPNELTIASLFFSLLSAALFAFGHLIAGAIVFHIGFLFDCLDGKLARWTGRTSEFGGWLDVIADRLGLSCNVVALAYYQSGVEPDAWLWYITFLSFELLSTISGKVVTLHESKKAPAEKEEERKHFRGDSSFKFLYALRDRLADHKLPMPPVGSVEMIMLTLFFGPLLNFPITAAKIAAVMMAVLFFGTSTTYWRKEAKRP